MARTIFDNIVIKDIEKATWFENCPYSAIRFFEILFIKEGSGSLIINEHSIPYNDNQIFIFVPNDKYTFDVGSATTVSSIKFLNSFFNEYSSDSGPIERKEWFKKIEIVLHSTNRTTHVKLRSETEESIIMSLFKVICKEYHDKDLQSKLIIKNTLYSILHILSRNVGYSSLKSASSKIQEMLNYIHYHIYDSEKISNNALAERFNISENYVGEYFKKQMEISLKKYILNHKLKLAETRLRYTDLTNSEIAIELGFTDSSHLDKTFLAYKGVTAGTFRSSHKS